MADITNRLGEPNPIRCADDEQIDIARWIVLRGDVRPEEECEDNRCVPAQHLFEASWHAVRSREGLANRGVERVLLVHRPKAKIPEPATTNESARLAVGQCALDGIRNAARTTRDLVRMQFPSGHAREQREDFRGRRIRRKRRLGHSVYDHTRFVYARPRRSSQDRDTCPTKRVRRVIRAVVGAARERRGGPDACLRRRHMSPVGGAMTQKCVVRMRSLAYRFSPDARHSPEVTRDIGHGYGGRYYERVGPCARLLVAPLGVRWFRPTPRASLCRPGRVREPSPCAEFLLVPPSSSEKKS